MKILLLCFAVVWADLPLKKFLESNRQFSANLYKELSNVHNGSFVFCPLSLEIILSLLHAGANNETAEQLAYGLFLPNNSSEIAGMMGEITPILRRTSVSYFLSVLNKIYVSSDFDIIAEFNDVASDVFSAEIEGINFNDANEAVQTINSWVANKTNDTIHDLIKSRDLDDNTRAVVINALYMQGVWENKFTIIKPAKFYINATETVDVDMMEQTQMFWYHESGELNAKILKMKYRNTQQTMIIVLPNAKDGLDGVEAKIDKALLEPKLTRTKVHIKLPKFKVDATIELVPILRRLGIDDLFTPKADLSNMSKDLFINDIVQKNYMDVNENGTTAASASRATARLGSSKGQPREFIADHPFIYYIQSPAGVMFVGRFAGTHL